MKLLQGTALKLLAVGVLGGQVAAAHAIAWTWVDWSETESQQAVAASLEQMQLNSNALASEAWDAAFNNGTAGANASAVLNSLSGDAYASVASSLASLGGYGVSLSAQRLHANLTAGFHAGAPIAQTNGSLPASAWPTTKALPVWVEVVGRWRSVDADANNARLSQHSGGVFVGGDTEWAQTGWRIGGSLGLTHTDAKVRGRDSKSDINSYSATVFGGKSFAHGVAQINVLGGASYTWHDVKTNRNVALLGQTLRADYTGHTAQVFAEVGYALGQYDKFGFEPFVGLSVGEQRTGRLQETGGTAALSSAATTDTLISSTVGLRMHQDTKFAGKETRLRATVGWKHAFESIDANKTMAFAGQSGFTVTGTPLARNTGFVGGEAHVALNRSTAVTFGLNTEFGGKQREHAAYAKLHWAY